MRFCIKWLTPWDMTLFLFTPRILTVLFIVWGFLHGAVMVVERLLSPGKDRIKSSLIRTRVGALFALCISRLYLFVMIMMLFAVFRLTTLDDILYIWTQILSLDFATIKAISTTFIVENGRLLDRLGSGLSINMVDHVAWANMLIFALVVVFFLPNTYQLFSVEEDSDESTQKLTWRAAVIVGVLGAWALILVLSSTAKEFIYFAF